MQSKSFHEFIQKGGVKNVYGRKGFAYYLVELFNRY